MEQCHLDKSDQMETFGHNTHLGKTQTQHISIKTTYQLSVTVGMWWRDDHSVDLGLDFAIIESTMNSSVYQSFLLKYEIIGLTSKVWPQLGHGTADGTAEKYIIRRVAMAHSKSRSQFDRNDVAGPSESRA